jgi:hypothetical protein
MDGSGDLGFDLARNKTSQCFLITFLLTADKKSLEKIVKKTFAELSKTRKKIS